MAVTDLVALVSRLWRNGIDGGTPITAEELNRHEDLLRNHHQILSQLLDRTGNVESGGSDRLTVSIGGAADRPPGPVLGRVHLNTETKRPEFGWGTEWRTADGVLVTAGSGGTGSGGTGTSNAPLNPYARTNPDGSIDTGCDPVTSPAGGTYSLYELRQSAPLVTGLATPSSHRTPSGTGTYGYSWTYTVGGVESARSQIAYCARPYGAKVDQSGGASGGGTAGTPADLLNFGTLGGFWSIDIAEPGGNKSYEYDVLEDGFSKTGYFTVLDDQSAVAFRCPVTGGTTPNSEYPRVELRERNSDGSKKAFDGSKGVHAYAAQLAVTDLPSKKPEIVVFQFHDAADDTLQVRLEGTTLRLALKGEELDDPLLTGYSLGTFFALNVRLDAGRLSVKINGSEKYNGKPGFGAGQYGKIGAYVQSNLSKGEPTSAIGRVLIKRDSLAVSHSS